MMVAMNASSGWVTVLAYENSPGHLRPMAAVRA
jgi:hypothetical protein